MYVCISYTHVSKDKNCDCFQLSTKSQEKEFQTCWFGGQFLFVNSSLLCLAIDGKRFRLQQRESWNPLYCVYLAQCVKYRQTDLKIIISKRHNKLRLTTWSTKNPNTCSLLQNSIKLSFECFFCNWEAGSLHPLHLNLANNNISGTPWRESLKK